MMLTPASMLLSIALLASSVPVDIARFDPADFPNLTKLEKRLPHGEMTKRVEAILAKRSCQLDGQSKNRFDLTVPYAVQMQADGRAKKVVVGDIGCRPIELLVGQVVVAQAARGDFPAPAAAGAEMWYSSELNFSLGEPTGTLDMAQADKMICKREHAQLGSRLNFVKTCKTAAEWKAVQEDRAQLRRDLANGACRPGGQGC